jgi:biopolymer transport protein ExbB/TolQ
MLLDIIQDRTQDMNNVELNFSWLMTLLGTVGFMLITYFIKQAKEKHDESHKNLEESIEKLESKNIKYREDFLSLQNELKTLDSRTTKDFKHIEDKIDYNNKILIDKLSDISRTFDEKLSDLKGMFKELRDEKK